MHKRFYNQAAEEMAAGLVDDALWVKAVAETGDAARAVPAYLRMRAREIQIEGLAAGVHRVAGREARARFQAWLGEAIIVLVIFGIVGAAAYALLGPERPTTASAPATVLASTPVTPTGNGATPTPAKFPVASAATSAASSSRPATRRALNVELGTFLAGTIGPDAGKDPWSLDALNLDPLAWSPLDGESKLGPCPGRCKTGLIAITLDGMPFARLNKDLVQGWEFELRGQVGDKRPPMAFLSWECYHGGCGKDMAPSLRAAGFSVSPMCGHTTPKGGVMGWHIRKGAMTGMVSHAWVFNENDERLDMVFAFGFTSTVQQQRMCTAPGDPA